MELPTMGPITNPPNATVHFHGVGDDYDEGFPVLAKLGVSLGGWVVLLAVG